MPELPEVETVVRSLQPVAGRRIVAADFRCPRILRGAEPLALAARIRGRRIASIARRGKFILLALEEGGYLIVHLGMTGRLLLDGTAGKHTHAVLTLERGALLYDDSRQFGCIQFGEDIPARVAALGPEPLEVSFDDFAAALRARKSRLKPLLLNQRFLSGVGNIYADESLFRAGIHPLSQASRLSTPRARKLFDAIRAVLSEAIAAGGSSISDYVDAEGRKGFFQQDHRVYGRTGEPCVRCGTPVRRLVIAQRSAHFCPKCQKR